MVNELASAKGVSGSTNLLMQLAIDEGLPVGQAIAVKLKEMQANRNLHSDSGFCALFRTLHGIGDKSQATAIEPFLNDKDGWVAYYASQDYGPLKLGLRTCWAVGY